MVYAGGGGVGIAAVPRENIATVYIWIVYVGRQEYIGAAINES
jgi:hypothetical protein